MPLIYPKSRVLARRKQMVWEQMHSGLGPALEQVHPKHGYLPSKAIMLQEESLLQLASPSLLTPPVLWEGLSIPPPTFLRVFLVPVQPLAHFA